MSSTSGYRFENAPRDETRTRFGRMCSLLMRDGSIFEVTDPVVCREIGVFRKALQNSTQRTVRLDMSEYYPCHIMRLIDNVKVLNEGGVNAAINLCRTLNKNELDWFKYQAHALDCPVVLNAIEDFKEYLHTLATNKRIEKWLEDSERAMRQ